MIKIRSGFVLLLCTILAFSAVAQSDMDERKIRFGLFASPNFGWLKPNIPEFDKSGLQPRMGFGYGAIVDYKFSESPNYLLSSGFNLTTNGGGLIEPWETVITETDTSYRFLGKNDRTYRMQYVNVPILLKMRTGDVGYFSYFGAIGVDLGFRTRSRINNTYTWLGTSQLQPEDEKDIDFNAHSNFMRMALNLTLGAEYNLTGNTNIYVGAGFHNGFTNLFNGKNANRILDPASDGTPALDALNLVIPSQKKKASSYYISLDVGVFF